MANGRYEISAVTRPDEFHDGNPESVTPGFNNNAYTNRQRVYTRSLTTPQAHDGFVPQLPVRAPSYEWRDVQRPDGAVAFDCVKCPVAELLASHNASELCVQTVCRLDFPLAETWGGHLKRTGTIASGAPRCDFSWLPRESPEPTASRTPGRKPQSGATYDVKSRGDPVDVELRHC